MERTGLVQSSDGRSSETFRPAREPFGGTPDGFAVGARTVQLDAGGGVVQQWVKERAETRLIEDFIDWAKARFGDAGLPRVAQAPFCEDTLTVYPLADFHIGMRAWARECGQDWDLAIARRVLGDAAARLVEAAPPSGRALVLGLGDYTHNNDATNLTPRSKHALDVDGRYQKVLEEGFELAASIVECAARRPTVTKSLRPACGTRL
jgi:hypothetical protein